MFKILCAAAVAVLVAGTFVGCDKLPGREEPDAKPPLEHGPAAGIEGMYEGSGTNPDGTAYECDVKIAPKGDAYGVIWYFDGQAGYEGTGILKGKTFVVGFASPDGYGVVAYTVGADGTLDGTWTGAGGTKTGTETLKKQR
jgi:hypothetical protein